MTTNLQSRQDELVLPVLLSEARKTYGRAIREALAAAGFDDMPRAGARVVGGIARNGAIVGDVASATGVSKQAASKLVDTLVVRGYVDRVTDDLDRRRTRVELTARGTEAAATVRTAVEGIDGALATAIGVDGIATLRATLQTLASLSCDAKS